MDSRSRQTGWDTQAILSPDEDVSPQRDWLSRDCDMRIPESQPRLRRGTDGRPANRIFVEAGAMLDCA